MRFTGSRSLDPSSLGFFFFVPALPYLKRRSEETTSQLRLDVRCKTKYGSCDVGTGELQGRVAGC